MKAEYRSRESVRRWQKRKQVANAAAGVCINGPYVNATDTTRPRRVEHGPVVQGGRCQHCLDVKRRSH